MVCIPLSYWVGSMAQAVNSGPTRGARFESRAGWFLSGGRGLSARSPDNPRSDNKKAKNPQKIIENLFFRVGSAALFVRFILPETCG
jgi:hypothetical protein